MQCLQAVNRREPLPPLGLNGREKDGTPRAEKGAGWGRSSDRIDLVVTGSQSRDPKEKQNKYLLGTFFAPLDLLPVPPTE